MLLSIIEHLNIWEVTMDNIKVESMLCESESSKI